MFFRKKTREWKVLDYLKSDEDIANYLEAALDEHDYEYLIVAVADVIEALRRKNARYSKMRK